MSTPDFSSTPPVPVTVVILTMNEAANIVPCLKSCAWCDDVHVLDSGSSDETIALAKAHGATVHHHPFESFGAQRNWAIDNITARHEWHFHLDADERFTPELVKEMARTVDSDGTRSAYAAYFVASKLIFMGRWLRYSATYPTYQMRFFHRARCRFQDFGHGQREETQGEVGTLAQPYLHFNFSKGLSDWFAKHNRYSSQEAAEALKQRGESSGLRAVLTAKGIERRRALKNLSYALPGRPLLRFLYSYGVRGGWRDGRPGLSYCLMLLIYEYMTELKMQEMKRSASQEAAP